MAEAAAVGAAPITEPIETGVPSGEGGPQGTELTLSQREQALWDFIKSYRLCQFVQNTRFFANT